VGGGEFCRPLDPSTKEFLPSLRTLIYVAEQTLVSPRRAAVRTKSIVIEYQELPVKQHVENPMTVRYPQRIFTEEYVAEGESCDRRWLLSTTALFLSIGKPLALTVTICMRTTRHQTILLTDAVTQHMRQ